MGGENSSKPVPGLHIFGPRPGLPDSGPLLQHLDQAACRHRRGPSADGRPLAAVHEVLGKISVPGSGRSGLPDFAFSELERKALRHRFYPFAPDVAPEELEQMLLLQSFEELVSHAQQRPWSFADRSWRESIPKSLLGQVLQAALQREPFVDCAYSSRHDCLLLALHHRSVPGQVLWHAWHGDNLTAPQDPKWKSALVTSPTFNDWKVHGGGAPANVQLIENMDAREMGYNTMVEKLAVADGSLILVTSMESGVLPGETRCPRSSRRLARVLKDRLTFGIVERREPREPKESQEVPDEAPEPSEVAPEPESVPEGPPGGVFWLALPSGARVTARNMPAKSDDSSTGSLLSYTTTDGQVRVLLKIPVAVGWGGGKDYLSIGPVLFQQT